MKKTALNVVYFLFIQALFAQTPKFNIGDKVQANATINVRTISNGIANPTSLGLHYSGQQGIVTAGPTNATLNEVPHVWYNVSWSTAPTSGWSAEEGLDKVLTDGASFVSKTISDNTTMTPGQNFTQVFRMRNSGTTTWTPGANDYTLNFVSGSQMGAPSYVTLTSSVSPGNEVDISITMTAPTNPGTHTGNWRMNNSSSIPFGDQVWVQIVVPSSLLPPPTLISPGLLVAPGTSVSTTTPTFYWQAVTGADQYGFYVSKKNISGGFDLLFNSEDRGITITGTSYTLPIGILVNGGEYRWNMKSHNSAGWGTSLSDRLYFYVSLPQTNPTISGVSPSLPIGSNNAQMMTINGSGFASGATVTWRDLTFGQTYAGRTPSSITNTQITINATFGNDPSNWDVQIVQSSGSSNQYSFSVQAPFPVVTSLNPNSATAGGLAFLLTVNGSTFHRGSIVCWNGSNRTTTPVLDNAGKTTALQASILASDITTSGLSSVAVYSPGPGGGTSTGANFQIIPQGTSNIVSGIDVSHWQNDAGPITWSSVYGSGVRFVFVKASESYDVPDGVSASIISSPLTSRLQRLTPLGSLRKGVIATANDHFLENIQGATSAGLIGGAYHLTRPDFPLYPSDYTQSAIAEAQYFLSRAGNYIGSGTYLPAALDVEITGGLSPSQLSQWIRTWFQYVQQQKSGTIPVLYTTRSILLILDNDLVTNYHLWIATDDGDPTGTPSYSGTSWPNWKFKQYRFGESGGTVTGVTGPVDLDSFNGDLAALVRILPVEVSVFSAIARESQVELSWRTETEIKNYGFEIERKVIDQLPDGWQTLGFVSGTGTTNSPHDYLFIDYNLSPGRYVYRIKQIDNNGSFRYYGNAEVEMLAPSVFALEQNYPNPFNPSTVILYALPVRSFVRLEVFDVFGRMIENLASTEQDAGYHEVTWRASVPSGTYFYRIEAVAVNDSKNRFTSTKKLMVLK